MKIILLIYALFIASQLALIGCGGGTNWTQCQPCDIDCEEELIVATPEFEK